MRACVRVLWRARARADGCRRMVCTTACLGTSGSDQHRGRKETGSFRALAWDQLCPHCVQRRAVGGDAHFLARGQCDTQDRPDRLLRTGQTVYSGQVRPFTQDRPDRLLRTGQTVYPGTTDSWISPTSSRPLHQTLCVSFPVAFTNPSTKCLISHPPPPPSAILLLKSPHGLAFTRRGCFSTKLAHSFLSHLCLSFCLPESFTCTSFHPSTSPDISAVF